MEKLAKILEIRNDFTPEEIELLKKAADFAEQKHFGQARKSGEPYLNHCLATGQNLAILNMDAETIAAGILHDTLEDTKTTKEELLENFGPNILFLVEGVTKLGKLKYHGAERHIESLRKFFVAMAEDIRVVIVKLADRLHNVQTLKYVAKEKQERLAKETIEIHARLADRLGMHKLKTELEDAALPYAYPKESERIAEILKNTNPADSETLAFLFESLKEDLLRGGVEILNGEYRLKGAYSLFRKLKNRGNDLSKIHDRLALRFIVKNIEDCYRAMGLIHGAWKPMPGRIKDYIALPKPNGYRSLHTTIFIDDGLTLEVQIRTEEMHLEAEYGITAHWVYKEVAPHLNLKVREKTKWTNDLLKWQNELKKSEDFLSHLKTDFFEHRVFVFTPKGDVIDLPDGASPIDFAYAIHSDIGHKTSGAKVNNRLVSLDTALSQGDMVEILTNQKARPNQKWLEYVKTTAAKKHIRHALEKSPNFFKIFSRR